MRMTDLLELDVITMAEIQATIEADLDLSSAIICYLGLCLMALSYLIFIA